MASNHGKLCRDLVGGSLQIKSHEVLDSHRNLCVENAKIKGAAKVKGDLTVCGDYKTKCGDTLTSACSTFFTPITSNWKSVSAAVSVPSNTHVYGQMGGGPAQPPKVMYTVPAGRCALTLAMSQDGPNAPDARASYAVRDNSNTYYLVGARGEGLHHERFVYMDSGDSLVVWGLPSQSFNAAAAFVEFDKTLPDGCFYQLLRLSSTASTAMTSYTIPAGHSAVFCPNLLPLGEDGENASESMVFGRDGQGPSVDFEVTNVINSINFTERVSVSDRDPFNTSDDRPRLTAFSAGDTFKLAITDNSENVLATLTTALFVKPNPCD
jgi:hypothetical protein